MIAQRRLEQQQHRRIAELVVRVYLQYKLRRFKTHNTYFTIAYWCSCLLVILVI